MKNIFLVPDAEASTVSELELSWQLQRGLKLQFSFNYKSHPISKKKKKKPKKETHHKKGKQEKRKKREALAVFQFALRYIKGKGRAPM